MNLLFLFFVMFVGGVYAYCSSRKHLLLMLLSLEFIILSLFMYLYNCLLFSDAELYFSMIYLVFCVCESVLGLSVLVSLIRTHGNDYVYSMNLMC
uniref:NADH-ubiquinone oxidoreductase chain 4L n=1 Tax=Noteridae sp. MJTNT-2012 TaxID=1227477 RepID=S4SUB6_9COLE|nr:NADH dehydrogenase subunit 4L [Noteridae sp. MJTNT-2012]